MLRTTILTTALALVAAPAAFAQERESESPPPEAVVVAGPTASGATLVAWDRGDDLCVQLRARVDGFENRRCARSGFSERPVISSGAAHAVVAPGDAGSVELRFARGDARASGPAVAGDAYRGRFAGRVRFAIVDGPDDGVPWLARFLDAGGSVIGATEGDGEAPRLAGPFVLAASRVGGRRYELRAEARTALSPLPRERDRLGREVCIWFQRAGAPRDDDDESCERRAQPESVPLIPSIEVGCRRSTVFVQASPGVARARAVLGDGRTVEVPLSSFPASLGFPGRAGVLVVTGRVAVRRIVALGPAGQTIRSTTLGAAPAGGECDEGPEDVASSIFGFDELFRQVGAPRPSVADDGTDLCVAIGDIDRTRHCWPPPVGPGASVIISRRVASGLLLFGAVPGDVASVDVPGGGRVETTAGAAGYAGQYRDDVRFFTASVSPAAADNLAVSLGLDGFLLRDSSGFVVGEAGVLAAFRYSTEPVRVRGLPPGVRVGAIFAGRARFLCIVSDEIGPFISGPPCAPMAIRGRFSTDSATAVVDCSPRRATLFMRGDRRAVARLADGRRLRGRIVRALGVPLRVIAIPRDATVRDVVARGSRSQLDLPPATRQCGYAAGVSSTTTSATDRARPVAD